MYRNRVFSSFNLYCVILWKKNRENTLVKNYYFFVLILYHCSIIISVDAHLNAYARITYTSKHFDFSLTFLTFLKPRSVRNRNSSEPWCIRILSKRNRSTVGRNDTTTGQRFQRATANNRVRALVRPVKNTRDSSTEITQNRFVE